MSNYIAVDLKVIEVLAPMVARAAGVSEDRALGGLVRLWHRCWSTTSDVVTESQLAGIFGGERISEVASALEADFLEPVADGWRVRGAGRYLRLKESRRRGALKTNALRASKSVRSESVEQRPLNDALPPSTEHRAPNTELKEEEPPPSKKQPLQFDLAPPDPTTPLEAWTRQDFWRWAELRRRAVGLPQERWPNESKLRDWWQEARTAAAVEVLQETYLRFGDAAHWQAARPPLPFNGFMTCWNEFLPIKRSA